jgi:alkylated DNA repair dioxygenase AlkB
MSARVRRNVMMTGVNDEPQGNHAVVRVNPDAESPVASPVFRRTGGRRILGSGRMAQLSLFDSGERLLADDDRGRITYIPGVVDADTAAAWFTELRDAVNWRAERRLMYDREVDVPRLTGHYRLDPPPASVPPAIREAATRVIDRLDIHFNSVGLNRYRDGRDSVAPHNDHLNDLQEGYPIALLSLGATRRMTVRAKEEPPRVLHVELEPGSLFVMDYATQIHYTHAIPKTTAAIGERISLAFRVKRRRDGSDEPAGGLYK